MKTDHDVSRVPDEQLRRDCDAESLGFETTAEVAALDGTIGQERAVDAIGFGLDIPATGYNVYVSGPSGTGRNTTLRGQLERIAASRPVPADWCYVYNFQEPNRPCALSLPAGRGSALAKDMDEFIEACQREIPKAFESDVYTERREAVTKEIQERREELLREAEREAQERGFVVNATPVGIVTTPVVDGQSLSREEFQKYPEEQRKEIQARGQELEAVLGQIMSQVRRLDKDAAQRTRELDREVALFTIGPLLNELRQGYVDIPRAMECLDDVENDIVEHLDMFRGTEEQQPPFPLRPREESFNRYKVNVIVNNAECRGAPVIIESSPTYYNLFGRVEYRPMLGAILTDHTMIRPGAIHRANGGYLVVQAFDLLTSILGWDTLKRTLRSREARIENLGEQYSAIPTATLSPEPIPLNVKVVMVGSPFIYHYLYRVDEDFRKFFRVKADFGTDMDRSPENIRRYAAFISDRCRELKLRPFHRTAVAGVVEYGSRLVEHQHKLSTRFIEIADILTEADFWAGKEGSEVVMGEHVLRAIEEKVYRSSLLEERLQEFIEEGTIMIDTEGQVVGQVNGISLYDLGDYRFGRPNRITARVSMGRGQVVNIERETHLSGPIHSKAFMTLSGYLSGKYAREKPLALSASIGFEQVYDEVEGDSASAAELYALLSVLADATVYQGVAVTGSVNQRGEVQAVGGVVEKIEGFYAVCKARGLTGRQGVIIPAANIKNLMLKQEAVQAVREGHFHIWGVRTVDEGLPILMGLPAGEPGPRGRYRKGTLNRAVVDRLDQMARRAATLTRPGRGQRKPLKAQGEDGEEDS